MNRSAFRWSAAGRAFGAVGLRSKARPGFFAPKSFSSRAVGGAVCLEDRRQVILLQRNQPDGTGRNSKRRLVLLISQHFDVGPGGVASSDRERATFRSRHPREEP